MYLIALPIAAAARRRLPASHPPAAPATVTAPDHDPARHLRMRDLLRRAPRLRWAFTLSFTTMVLLYAIVVFVLQRLAQLGVTQPLVVSAFIAATAAAASLVGLVYGRIRRHLGYRQLLLAGLALPVAAFVILAAATRPWMLLAGVPLFGLGMGLIMPALPVLAAESAPARREVGSPPTSAP